MNDVTFAHAERLHFVWVGLLFVLVLAWLELHGRGVLTRFVLPAMQRRLALQLSTTARVIRLVGVFGVFVLIAFALARPQLKETRVTTRKAASADVMFVVDVSRSMLAADAAPSRLERAKAEIRDLLPSLEGSRLGLIAFAGRASVMSPLTPDHGFFSLVLDDADPDAITRGGTRIGDALRTAVDAFGEDEDGAGRAIILITDGEDHESYPEEAAKAVKDANITVIAIGFGSEEGSPIYIVDPDTGATEEVRDSADQVVISRLDGDLLRKLALDTDGAYVPAGTAVLDLESIVDTHITPLLAQKVRTVKKEEPTELYPWFILAAMLLMTGMAVVGVVGLQAPRGDGEPTLARGGA